MKAAVGTKPFWGRCDACGHCWPVAWLPMLLSAAAGLMQAARCPRCSGGKVMVAKQDDGVLLEPGAEQFTRIAENGGSHVAGA